MMEKYGKDYDAMANDAKNVFSDTPDQIEFKITAFKNIPIQYDAYLQSKAENAGDEERFL
jgi:hypothetical protein